MRHARRPPLRLRLRRAPLRCVLYAPPALLCSADCRRCPLSSVVCELCREHLGVHPCDRRRPLAAYRAAFPALDWSQCETEEARTGGWRQRFALSLTCRCRTSCGRQSGARRTRSWRSAPPSSCAGALCALNRSAALTPGAALRCRLMARPEQHIAVVTHSSWLDVMFRSFTGECSPAAGERLRGWFKNAEVRSRTLCVRLCARIASHGRPLTRRCSCAPSSCTMRRATRVPPAPTSCRPRRLCSSKRLCRLLRPPRRCWSRHESVEYVLIQLFVLTGACGSG